MMENIKKNDPIWEIGNEKGGSDEYTYSGRKWKNRDRIEWHREEKGINKREGERNMRKERENGGFSKHWHRRGEARWQHGASLASTELMLSFCLYFLSLLTIIFRLYIIRRNNHTDNKTKINYDIAFSNKDRMNHSGLGSLKKN